MDMFGQPGKRGTRDGWPNAGAASPSLCIGAAGQARAALCEAVTTEVKMQKMDQWGTTDWDLEWVGAAAVALF